jgi:hypothetical protein
LGRVYICAFDVVYKQSEVLYPRLIERSDFIPALAQFELRKGSVKEALADLV